MTLRILALSIALAWAIARPERPETSFRFFKVRISATSTAAENYAGLPKTISATGLFADLAAKTVGPGSYAYVVNSPLWADGATASRYLILPRDSVVTYVNDSDSFRFPEGAVLVKNLVLDTVENQVATRRFMESRLLVFQEGAWHGFSYRWRPDQDDADLVGGAEGGFAKDSLTVRTADGGLRKKRWLFPARIAADFHGHREGMVSCNSCHLNYAPNSQSLNTTSDSQGVVLGFKTPQLSRRVDGKDQILDLIDQGFMVMQAGAAYDPAAVPKWYSLDDSASPGSTLEKRARSYLASNCYSCHRPGGGTMTGLDFTYRTGKEPMGYIDRQALGNWGLPIPPDSAKWISPGSPERSIVLRRISAADSDGYRDTTDWGVHGRGPGRPLARTAGTAGWPGTGKAGMPPLATYETNPLADRVLLDWIESLGPQGVSVGRGKRAVRPGPRNLRWTNGPNRFPGGLPPLTGEDLIDARGRRIGWDPRGEGGSR